MNLPTQFIRPCRMVDVSAKADSTREARAMAVVKMKPETLQAIAGAIAKGCTGGSAGGCYYGGQTDPAVDPYVSPLMLAAVDGNTISMMPPVSWI